MAVRKRGNSYQVTYRCPGESSPRTETFQSEDEALLRDMQIKLAKKNGTFTPQRPYCQDIFLRFSKLNFEVAKSPKTA